MSVKKLTQATCLGGLVLGFATSVKGQTIEPDTNTDATPDTIPDLEEDAIAPTNVIVPPETTLAESSHESRLSQSVTPAETSEVTPRLGVDFTTGEGVGYSSSFTGLEGFVPLSQTPDSVTFLQGRVNLTTEGTNASGNVIIGHRFYDTKSDSLRDGRAERLYGGYIALDRRNTGNSTFNQIGVGVETLGTWDVRANAYFPLGDTRQLVAETTTSNNSYSQPFFQQNYLATTRTLQQRTDREYEAAMTGFDLEVGGKIASIGTTGDLRGYGGIYYYNASGSSNILGWQTRLEARPNNTFRVGLALSQDDTFGTNLVLNVGASFGSSPRRNRSNPVLARLGESVTRRTNIVVDEQQETQTSLQQEAVFLSNPKTGQPWIFRHVNLGIGTGNGTFESPTETVAESLAIAQPNDIVYVQSGTNLGIPAFTIPDGVQVLSTGPTQFIDTVELANIQLPLSGTGLLPTVQGTATLGNDTTLSGFTLNAGIVGNNIINVTVRENVITNSPQQGILLNNVAGQVTVRNNTIANSALEGFSLNNNQGQVNLNLVGNTINNNGNLAIDGDGVNIELRNTATGIFDIINNSITNNIGSFGIADGLEIKAFDTVSATFNLSHNTIIGNQLNGVAIDLESKTQATFNLLNNTINNNQLSGISTLLSNRAVGTFTLNNNTVDSNQLKGIEFIFANNTTGTINLNNNVITNNQDDGVYLQFSDLAIGAANLASNTISNNRRYGVFTTTNDTAKLRLSLTANQIINNNFSGLSINAFDFANNAALILSNTFTGNSLGDLEVVSISPNSTVCLQPQNNTINSLFFNDLGGNIQVETGTLSTNSISTSNIINWSGTTVPSGTCGF